MEWYWWLAVFWILLSFFAYGLAKGTAVNFWYTQDKGHDYDCCSWTSEFLLWVLFLCGPFAIVAVLLDKKIDRNKVYKLGFRFRTPKALFSFLSLF